MGKLKREGDDSTPLPCFLFPYRASHSSLSSSRRKQSVLYASNGHAADNILSAAAFTSANVAVGGHFHSTLQADREGGKDGDGFGKFKHRQRRNEKKCFWEKLCSSNTHLSFDRG